MSKAKTNKVNFPTLTGIKPGPVPINGSIGSSSPIKLKMGKVSELPDNLIPQYDSRKINTSKSKPRTCDKLNLKKLKPGNNSEVKLESVFLNSSKSKIIKAYRDTERKARALM